jgi:hypothetical protein
LPQNTNLPLKKKRSFGVQLVYFSTNYGRKFATIEIKSKNKRRKIEYKAACPAGNQHKKMIQKRKKNHLWAFYIFAKP